jgi:hypothetical protein
MNDLWLSLHGLGDLAGTGDGDRLHLQLGDASFDLGGVVGDCVTLSDDTGTTVYADLDGDGVVDHISSVHHDGRYDVFTADPHAAAWGLTADIPGKSATGEAARWGLAPGDTPERGDSVSGESRRNAGWHRIEGG